MRHHILTVRGLPAPQGSKRHVGGGRMIESSTKVTPWREAIRAVCQERKLDPLAGGLGCELVFTMKKPAGAPRRRVTFPARRPDLDKLARSTLDGLAMGGAYSDDSQIIYLSAWKVYADCGHPDALDVPGARITLVELGDTGWSVPPSWLAGLVTPAPVSTCED